MICRSNFKNKLDRKASVKMYKKQTNHLLLVFFISALLLAGCAHKPATPSNAASTANSKQVALDSRMEDASETNAFEDEFEEHATQVADPLAPWNRLMFHFNDKFYFWVLKPLSKGYRALVPRFVRTSVSNFFHNISAPIRMANCLLQGKGHSAGIEMGSFMINSTWGVLGLRNLTQKYPDLKPSDEDLGQTLGAYGIGNGFYIVWPFLGPSTLRDTVGFIGDRFLYPVSYVKPMEASLGISGYKTVNETSFQIGDYETFKSSAIEPYEALKDAYIQHRKKKVDK